jgi:hypothetical protein
MKEGNEPTDYEQRTTYSALDGIEHYTNPKYKERFNGFVWGFVIGYIPYLWHMYI